MRACLLLLVKHFISKPLHNILHRPYFILWHKHALVHVSRSVECSVHCFCTLLYGALLYINAEIFERQWKCLTIYLVNESTIQTHFFLCFFLVSFTSCLCPSFLQLWHFQFPVLSWLFVSCMILFVRLLVDYPAIFWRIKFSSHW